MTKQYFALQVFFLLQYETNVLVKKKKGYAKNFAPITITLSIREDIKEKYIFLQVGSLVRKLRLTWTLNPARVVLNITGLTSLWFLFLSL